MEGTRVAAAAAAAIVAVLVFAPPAASVTGPDTRSVRWDGRSFSLPTDLAAWLSARGATYETWARRHPAAAARLEGEDPVGREAPVEPSGTTDEVEESVAGVAADDLSPSIWSSTSGKAALVLFGFALSLLLVAALPRSIFARAQAEAVWNRRLDLATVGLAVAVGLAIVLIF